MALRTTVIIREVSNLSDARFATGMGAEFIAFNLNAKSESFVSETDFTAMTSWLEGPTFAGEVDASMSVEDVKKIISSYELKAIV
ncbi:hypothetical protein OAH12_02805, partial [Cyclobacteriaceae bacterium]|nr:hypothetical protein [Cyclobacteriaceae bacterium]